jgi:hypothetical protein
MSEFKDTWAVNWQDGMLVSAKHFVDQQRYTDNLAKRLLGAISLDYGLVLDPLDPTPETSLSWRVEQPSERRLEVYLTSCRAIAPDGRLIAIYEEAESYNIAYFAAREIAANQPEKYSVYIEPTGKFVPLGIEEGGEDPPRLLYRIPEYKVRIVATTLEPVQALRVGRIVVADGEAQPDPRYIPPCTSMLVHPRLIEYRKQFYQYLKNLELRSAQCFTHLVNQRVPLGVFNGSDPEARVLSIFSRHFANKIAETIDSFRDDVSQSSPRQVVIYFKSLFRAFNFYLTIAGEHARQRLYELWVKHCDANFKPAEFDETMERFLQRRFSQENIAYFVDRISWLLIHLDNFFRLLLAKSWGADAPRPRARTPQPEESYDFEVIDTRRQDGRP